MKAATGSATLWGLGLEQEYGVPGSGVKGYKAILPLAGDVVGVEGETGQVNTSGFLERGIPGAKDGEVDFALPMMAAHLLEFYEHLFGSVAKSTLEAGVYQYVFTPTLAGLDTSFYGLVSKPPVEKNWLYGIKFGSIEQEIGDNEEIPTRMKGFASHGTRLGAAVAEGTLSGTYAKGPHLRGPLKNPAGGPVYVRVSRVLESAGGLQFKVEQTAGAPTFPGAAVSVAMDASTDEATWQNLAGATGLDLGYFDENKDPLEIIFPGSAEDHEDLVIGDTFKFPVTWSDPALTYITGAQRFTSAHWVFRHRAIDALAWIEKRLNTGKLTLEWEVTPDRGNGSRYPFAMLRDGLLTPTLEFEGSFVDRVFAEALDTHARIEAQQAFEGRQLGTGAHRESITYDFPSVRVDERKAPIANAKALKETVTLIGETDEAGAAPVTVTVITGRNWTPST